ncbi:MAG: bifunctional phosphopantothenoylcysteine decarboxylase/phosphopantothenate--cysteine ligase CoaBC [Gammaproteobacteria bacterium]
MTTLADKRILLGITGGIAAYKSADLVRRLRERGAEVRVVMTRAACEFITPLTFQALSGRPVHTDLLDHDAEAGMGHISLARWADVILIAPASADFMAKLSHGLADDLLSTLCLAADVPLLAAPAMNQGMWAAPATQANARTLSERGVVLLGPAEGDQACGETGPGRMLEVVDLLTALEGHFHSDLLAGRRIMVTAGPTREAIDPVRYISNRSSGRMGYAIARAAQEAGASVTLVSGPVALTVPDRVHCLLVESAEQMRNRVMDAMNGIDIFIAAAAVADYHSGRIMDQKIKKKDRTITLTLEKNPDILAEVAALQKAPFTVGFAAETEDVESNARGKLTDKKLDMIAANQVGPDLGFDSDENALQVYWRGGGVSLEKSSKDKLARRLVRVIAEQYYARHSDQAH